jgi:hypothetical protein
MFDTDRAYPERASAERECARLGHNTLDIAFHLSYFHLILICSVEVSTPVAGIEMGLSWGVHGTGPVNRPNLFISGVAARNA